MKNTLFKNKTSRTNGGLLFFALSFAALIFYSACPQHIALGGGVDILPPSGEISYPDAGETPIRGSFVLKGTAKDDEGVQAVSIVFENIETKVRTRSYQAILTKPGAYSTSWTARITNESTGTVYNHPLVKVYPIPDGEYTAIVTVTDNNGKTSKFTKNYKIDNTPPVFIVSRPSTIIVNDDSTAQADPYGSVFTVVGQAEDKNKIEDLTLKVEGLDVSISRKFVGKNINEELAAATADSSGFTDPLYKYNADHASPKIKGHVFLTDNARFFKGDGVPGTGNTSEWYYLRDKDIRDILDRGYTADIINDYFAGKTGNAGSSNKADILLASLYNGADVGAQKVKQILENARIMTDGSSVLPQRASVFTLDPNKSPGFKITGAINLPRILPGTTPEANFPQPSLQFFNGDAPPTLLIDLIPNKTPDVLVSSYDYSAYRESGIEIEMYKCNDVSYITDNDSKKLNVIPAAAPAYSFKFADLTAQHEADGAVTLSGGNQLTVKWKLPGTFAQGHYVIQVKGTDTKGNDFTPYNDANVPGGIFVINFKLAGNQPIIVPRSPTGYLKEDFSIIANVSSLGAGGEVFYNIDAPVNETAPDPAKKLIQVGSTTEYKLSPVSISGLTDEGRHTVHFFAKNSANQTAKAQIEFFKDTQAPVATLDYPSADAPQVGMVTVGGGVTDTYAGVKSEGTKYIIGKQTPVPDKDSTGWRVMDKTGPASWQFTYNLDDFSGSLATAGTEVPSQPGVYDIPVYILTEDNIGNKTVITKSVRFDSDGTKPIITVLFPQQNQILGGTIQIFGTATTRANGAGGVGEVYIQFSKNGNFSDTANGNMTFGTTDASYDADWYKGGNGQAVPDTASGGANWQISINGNGAFNNPNGTNWEVYFRLRAKNTGGTFGLWSTPVKISIDKAYPTVGSPDPLKVVKALDNSEEENYTSGMWIPDGKKLIGSLFDESGIKEVSISSPELLGSQIYNLSEAVSNGWITEDTAHAPNPPTGAKNYKLQIPLMLSTLSQNLKEKGELSIKIKIVENTPKELFSEETVKFSFDITPPIGGLGEFLYRYSGRFTTDSVTDSILAKRVKDNADGSNYGMLYLLVGNEIVQVSSVSGNRINFTPVINKAGTYNCLLYKKPNIISNSSGKWIVRGVANDDGSGIKKIEAAVIVDGQTASAAEIKDGKITKQLDGQVNWEGEIDLSSLKDGKGKLKCTIFDERDNEYEVPEVDVIVKNKPLKVKKLTLSTDIGGTAVTFANDNVNNALTDTQIDSNLDFTANFTSTGFAFKNKNNSKIKVDFEGGQGTVKYRLKKSDGTTVLQDLTAIALGGEIDLKNHFGTATDKINNSNGSPATIILELWDEAYGFAQGSDSAFAKVNITTLFDALDTTAPKVIMLPFHWNGENDNSLYQNSRTNGHVEIASVSGTGNTYSSVSGKVSVSGFAYDNIKIDKLTAVLPNASALSVNATRSGDTWTSDKNMASHGAVLTVETLGADYLGYYVKWRLDWDSEKTSVGVAKDITVSANDGTNDSVAPDSALPSVTASVTRSGTKTAQHSVFAGKNPGQFVVFTNGEKQYLTRIAGISGNKATLEDNVPVEATDASVYGYTANRGKISVNVVPYITNVETGLTSADGSFKGAFSRASTGEYPVRAGEHLKIKGFNLSGGTVMLGTTSLGTTLNNVSITLSHTSGELSVKVDSRDSINNKVDVSKPYNIEANNANNDILTAKRKLFVWKTVELIDNAALESPQFVMDKGSKYYMSYGNLKTIGSGSGAMRLSSKIDGAEDNNWEKCYSKYHNTVIAYDDSGKPYLGATNTDRSGQSTAFTLFFQQSEGSYAYSTDNHKKRLENSDNKLRNVYDVNRVQIPKMVIRGRGTSVDPAKLALVYFDKNVQNDAQVKFRYGTVSGSSSVSGGINHNVDSDGNDAVPANSGSAEGYEVVADNASAKKGGQYAAVGLTSTDRAVVVWYDASHSQLIYSYRDMGASYTEPTESNRYTSQWQANAVVIDNGAPLYVDLIVDEDDGVHIGYYSGSNNGVRYAYLAPAKVKGSTKPNTSDFKIATVDTYMNPGSYLKIGVRKESNKQVPYLSYYHNGFFGSANAARIAWLKDGIASATDIKNGVENGKFTGNWVVMTVPASNGIQQYTICQGTPTGGTYENKVIAAYFTNANYEMAVLQK